MLVEGGILVILAALLAGMSGFGLRIVAVPLLLLAGFSLPFIVTVVFLISVVTRLSVTVRLRGSINHRRVAVLTGAAIPSLAEKSHAAAVASRQQQAGALGQQLAPWTRLRQSPSGRSGLCRPGVC